jgi:hypothetical protein
LRRALMSMGEFSTKTRRGRTSPTIRANSRHSPLRSPPIPAPLPAQEMSWQGKPPHTASTRPRQGFPSKVRTSSQMGNLGRMPSRCRWSNTDRQYASISTAHTQVCPRSIPPRIPPPAPANRCSSFIRFLSVISGQWLVSGEFFAPLRLCVSFPTCDMRHATCGDGNLLPFTSYFLLAPYSLLPTPYYLLPIPSSSTRRGRWPRSTSRGCPCPRPRTPRPPRPRRGAGATSPAPACSSRGSRAGSR